jgi:transposase
MPKQQKTYTKEFKLEAVQLVKSSGKLMSQIARELGISDSALYQWSKQLADQGEQAFPGSGHQTARGGRSFAGSSGSWKSPGRSATF